MVHEGALLVSSKVGHCPGGHTFLAMYMIVELLYKGLPREVEVHFVHRQVKDVGVRLPQIHTKDVVSLSPVTPRPFMHHPARYTLLAATTWQLTSNTPVHHLVGMLPQQ